MRIKLKKTFLFVVCLFLIYVIFVLFVAHGRKQSNMVTRCANVTEVKMIHKETKNKMVTVTEKKVDVSNTASMQEVIRSLRNKIFQRFSQKQMHDYYSEEIVEKTQFNRSLSLTSPDDMALLKTLFPGHHSNFPTHSADRIVRQLSLRLNSSKFKHVLSLHNRDLTNEMMIKSQCKINRCTFTNNQKMLYKVDAVVLNYLPRKLERPVNKPEQIWIFNQLESPMHSAKVTSSVFNWTATYRTDSVITTPYEKFTTFPSYLNLPIRATKNYATGKTKLVAWFISNCGGANGRMEYVRELQKYVKVDIYGLCGDLSCNRYDKKCFEHLKLYYKFYLAFENSNCRDYITEKLFWNALSNDVVPIVMGAHPDDYKKLAPPESYIHVDEFNGPRQLAEYIHIVDRNDDLYNNYFRWKGTGTFINTKFICRLCAMLQVAPLFPMNYPNLGEWWKSNFTCVMPKDGLKWASWKNSQGLKNANELVRFQF